MLGGGNLIVRKTCPSHNLTTMERRENLRGGGREEGRERKIGREGKGRGEFPRFFENMTITASPKGGESTSKLENG